MIASGIFSLLATIYEVGKSYTKNSIAALNKTFSFLDIIKSGINLFSIILAIFVFLIICFVICIFIKPPEPKESEDERVFSKKGELGNAKVMSNQRADRVFPPQNIYNKRFRNWVMGWRNISIGDVYSLDTDTLANCNATVCGCPGSGKTVTQVYPYLMQCYMRQESFIVTDCSGETPERFYNFFKENGYETRWLNFINREHSDGINIFQFFETIDKKKKDVVSTANTIAALIAANCVKDEENYFSQSTESFLSFLLVKVYLEKDPKERNLINVYDLALKDTKELISILKELDPSNPIKRAAATWIANDKQQKQTQSTVQAWMKDLSSPSTRAIFTHDDVSISNPGVKKCAYFISIPATKKEAYWMPALICGLMLDVLMNDIANIQPDKALPVTTTFIMDEFPNIFKIPGWIAILNNIRKNHIHAIMLFQGLQDMEREYKESYVSIFNACHTNIFCGANDILTCQFYADWSADATSITERQARTLGIASATKQETLTKTTALTTDRIKKLNEEKDSHKAIIYEFSQDPFIVETFYWEEHPLADKIKTYPQERQLEHIPLWAIQNGNAALYMDKNVDKTLNEKAINKQKKETDKQPKEDTTKNRRSGSKPDMQSAMSGM